MANTIAGTLRVPNQNAAFAVLPVGGGVGGGVPGTTDPTLKTRVVYGGHMTYPTSGGALNSDAPIAGTALADRGGIDGAGAAIQYLYNPARKSVFGVGGALIGGDATEIQVRPNISAALTTVTASLAPPAFFNYINGRFPNVVDSVVETQVGDGGIEAELPIIRASFTVLNNSVANITAKLPKIVSAFVGGPQSISAALPLPRAVITGFVGEVGTVAADLPSVTANLSALTGTTGTVAGAIPIVTAVVNGIAGGVGTVSAALTRSGVALVSLVGTAGTITAELPVIEINATAGLGATGTVDASLTTLSSVVAVLTNATTQQLVMVVNTVNNAISTYESFPFNGFFELGGKYYATGAGGLVQIDVGGTDNGAEISAGLSTGLWDLKSDFQKGVFSAYLTVRLGGDMTVTTTVDEAARYPASTVTLNQLGVAQLVPRRVPLARGLRGKSWQFEFNNVGGADFDFSDFGVSLSESTRRIQGAQNG